MRVQTLSILEFGQCVTYRDDVHNNLSTYAGRTEEA